MNPINFTDLITPTATTQIAAMQAFWFPMVIQAVEAVAFVAFLGVTMWVIRWLGHKIQFLGHETEIGNRTGNWRVVDKHSENHAWRQFKRDNGW